MKKMETLNLFNDDLFHNLESLTLSNRTYFLRDLDHRSLNVKLFKKLSYLKSLTLKNVSLNGIDAEFNGLTEAFFSFRIPDNILNFYNLEKLCLEDFYVRISLDEHFLENMVNLEELELNNVFNSIDSNVRYLFKSLKKLKKLKISNNEIKILKSSYFDYLIDIEQIDLVSNAIQIIEPGAFKNCNQIKYLNVSHNSIKEIKKETFAANKNLEKISF